MSERRVEVVERATRTRMRMARGFTLIELMVAVSLFALVAMLAAGAYLVMLDVEQQAQANATGIDNLTFALSSMTRTIRTGTGYNCGSASGGDCSSGSMLYLTDQSGEQVIYFLWKPTGIVYEAINGAVGTPLTDSSVDVTNLTFVVNGSQPYSNGHDTTQPYVFITMSGTTSAGPGKTIPFTVQTSAVMRGTDL